MMVTLRWIIIGTLLRFIIMPFTGHWDLTSLHQVAHNLLTFGKDSLYELYFAIYPPLTYFVLAIWQKAVTPFVFSDWTSFLNDSSILAFSSLHVFRYLFLLKLPYLFVDVAIGLLLRELVSESSVKDRIFKLWMLNPVTLYATFAWGTIDIIPTFFTVLALFLFQKGRKSISLLILGTGAAFKAYPLLLIAPFCLISFRTLKERISGLFIGLIPFLLTVLPFITDENFFLKVFSSDQLQVIQHASFYIGRETHVSVFYILYTLLLFFLYRNRIFPINLSWFFFFVIFIFYSLSAFTPQWFVWGLPFLFLTIIDKKLSLKWYFLILVIYFSLVVLFEISLNLALLAPIDVSLLDYPSVGDKITKIFDINRLNGVIRSILSGIIIYLIILSKPKKIYES